MIPEASACGSIQESRPAVKIWSVELDILKAFSDYFDAAKAAILNAASEADLEQARIEFLGQKKGKLRDLQGLIGKASKEEKPLVGKKFNEVRTEVTSLLESRQQELANASSSDVVSDFDPTLPGHAPAIGNDMAVFFSRARVERHMRAVFGAMIQSVDDAAFFISSGIPLRGHDNG